MDKQTQRLKLEIAEHGKTDAKLQEATRAADRANTAKSRFLSNMSHEIRTPLNSILGYAYILHNDPSIPSHRRQAVEILKRSGEHLSSLIEDILDIAKIEACKFDLNSDPFNFLHFIEHLVSVFKPQAAEKGLAFKCQLLNTLPQRVKGDEKRVGQILINLLGNAIKFTGQGEVIFRAGYSCGVATFQVIDTGPGIDAEQLENIFQPFTQLANERFTPGSGLGLTISKILAQIMGGELSVKSIPGEGSIFTVRLYLANLGSESEAIPQAMITGYAGKRQRIIVVDDHADHRQLLRNILEPIGFTIEESIHGVDCLEKFQVNPADLILLDLNMPELDGFDTAYKLRELNIVKPIIVLTSDAYPADRVKAINAGCNDFLAKSLNVPELLSKLKLQLGLEWFLLDDEPAAPENPTAASDRQILPPPDIVLELASFARIGDMQGLHHYLARLSQKQPDYQDFLEQIEQLGRNYRLSDIKKLLEQQTNLVEYGR